MQPYVNIFGLLVQRIKEVKNFKKNRHTCTKKSSGQRILEYPIISAFESSEPFYNVITSVFQSLIDAVSFKHFTNLKNIMSSFELVWKNITQIGQTTAHNLS